MTAMRTDELDYHLPEGLIATQPMEPRDASRMMVARRMDGAWSIEHRQVRDLPEYVTADDLLVFNSSRVVPARLEGTRVKTGGHIEGLFLEEPTVGTWSVMLRSNGKLREGDQIELTSSARSAMYMLTLVERDAELWVARVEPVRPAAEVLEKIGLTPLPPYILKARGEAKVADDADRAWYQTVYAAAEYAGSVAAPTAGLHFTPELLARIDATGAKRAEVVLHVGPGTFKPVAAATLAEHVMHEEAFTIPAAARATIRSHRAPGSGARRLIAIGTTTVRALESVGDQMLADDDGSLSGSTRLMIAPPYRFTLVDGLLTNFHLPRSTLLALVAAMVGGDQWRAMYEDAVRERYRFYSYGDAMLILP